MKKAKIAGIVIVGLVMAYLILISFKPEWMIAGIRIPKR